MATVALEKPMLSKFDHVRQAIRVEEARSQTIFDEYDRADTPRQALRALVAADTVTRDALVASRPDLVRRALVDHQPDATVALADYPSTLAALEQRIRDGEEAIALMSPAIDQLDPARRAQATRLNLARFELPVHVALAARQELEAAMNTVIKPLLANVEASTRALEAAHHATFQTPCHLGDPVQSLARYLWGWIHVSYLGATPMAAQLMTTFWPPASTNLTQPIEQLRRE